MSPTSEDGDANLPADGSYHLPIAKVSIGAYLFSLSESRNLLRLIAPPVILLSVAYLAALALSGAGSSSFDAVVWQSVHWALYALFLATKFMFAVAWHRRYLVPGETSSIGSTYRWGMRQSRFAIAAVVVGVLGALAIASLKAIIVYGRLLVSAIIENLSFIGSTNTQSAPTPPMGVFIDASAVLPLILAIILALGFARFALLLPARAVDDYRPWSNIGRLSDGNKWRLVAIVSITGLPMYGVTYGTWWIDLILFSETDYTGVSALLFVSTVVGYTTAFIGSAIAVTALSIAYAEITSRAQRE